MVTADPDVCARCAETGPTCCRLEPGQEEFCFPLSAMERDRILDCSRGWRGAFAQEPNSKAFLGNMLNLFPADKRAVRELFPLTKHHMRLATRPDGSCVLLGKNGCRLPSEARPYYCRLFPLWVVGNSISLFNCNLCSAQKESRELGRILELLGMTKARVHELHGRLRLAWGLPPKEGMPRVDNPVKWKVT
jgi:Fe-S-cluster containining protein